MKQEENGQKNSSSKSMLRTALLNWYPFQNGKRALLVGSNTRPLHNLLERYFNTVDIVDAGDCQFGHLRIPCGAGYDCIVAADLVEMSKNVRELLRQLYDMLTDDGVMLLAFRNRFGLKYLCGGTDKYSETPFATLQPAGRGQRLYARREMEAMLCDAGFAEPRCYFMMPDADYVQAVYTEDYLPNDSIRDRVFPFDLHDSPLVAWGETSMMIWSGKERFLIRQMFTWKNAENREHQYRENRSFMLLCLLTVERNMDLPPYCILTGQHASFRLGQRG